MIRGLICVLGLLLSFGSCQKKEEISSINPENWSSRSTTLPVGDSLSPGSTYLSIYSQIYSQTEHKTHNLTAMASMRNTSDRDTIYLIAAKYYDTHGKLVRTYFEQPIYLAPMETTEIIIDEHDVSGGTGSNFIFEWRTPANCPEPLFEGIMTSTMGQQGLSFTTIGKKIK